MGYITNYSLQVELLKGEKSEYRLCDHKFPDGAKFCPECGKPTQSLDITEAVIGRLIEESDGAKYALDKDGGTSEGCKWYDHESDLRVISKQFPKVLFTLHGEGEESGDIWNKYFVNGKMQVAKAKVTFDEFDPKKLI